MEEALADAVVRAIHHAPETLLAALGRDKWRRAGRRLAIRIIDELAGDGWGANDFLGGAGSRGPCGASGSPSDLNRAILAGLAATGGHLLATLPGVRRVNGGVLDGVGRHIAGAILAAMSLRGLALRRLTPEELQRLR